MNVLIKKTLLTTIGIILMIAILALKQHVYTCPSKLGQHFFYLLLILFILVLIYYLIYVFKFPSFFF